MATQAFLKKTRWITSSIDKVAMPRPRVFFSEKAARDLAAAVLASSQAHVDVAKQYNVDGFWIDAPDA